MIIEMKKISLFVVVVSLIIYSASAMAADQFGELRKESAKIKTIQAHFVQKKVMKILSKPLISEGRFVYVAPDSFRWEYVKPLKSIVISHQGKTKRYIFSGGKMIEDTAGGAQAMKIVLGEVTGWMSGKFDQNPSFAATIREGANTEIILMPTGGNMAGMIEKIEITVTKKAAAVKTVKIIESANAYTVIDFKDMEINKPVDDSVFRVNE
jgi:outer membrane lipoprotein-sorting protein